MSVQECRKCGFKVVSDDSGRPPGADWLCEVCTAESAPPPPQPLVPETPGTPCPACGFRLKIDLTRGAHQTQCISCRQKLSVTATADVEIYDDFKDFLKRRATQLRKGVTPPPKPATTKARLAAAEAPAEKRPAPAEDPTSAVFLIILMMAPFIAGLVAAYWPGVLLRVQGIVERILRDSGIF